MKRKIKYFILFLNLLILVPSIIRAETWQCQYKNDEHQKNDTYEFNQETDSMKIINENKSNAMFNNYYYYEYNSYEQEIKTFEKNFCPANIFVYQYTEFAGNTTSYYYNIYTDMALRNTATNCVDNITKELDFDCVVQDLGFALGVVSKGEFYEMHFDKNASINSDKESADHCSRYDTMYKNLEKEYQKKPLELNKINQIIDEIKTTCNSILAYSNSGYVDENNKFVQYQCINSCINAKNDIDALKEKYDIYVEDKGQCGFSGRLLSFFSNILRWIKYILPVLTIVLSILDFVKAMGADKEDEMKKSQQRFIRRIIAAALLFIVPLILEFILDKMGFGYDDCGLF